MSSRSLGADVRAANQIWKRAHRTYLAWACASALLAAGVFALLVLVCDAWLLLCLALALPNALVGLDTTPLSGPRYLRDGLATASTEPFAASLTEASLHIRMAAQLLEIPLESIVSARLSYLDGMTRPAGIHDVLDVTVRDVDVTLRVPDCVTGFTELLDWLRENRTLETTSVGQ